MSDLYSLVQGLPGTLGNVFNNLAQNLQGIQDDLEAYGGEEIEIAGPEEDVMIDTGEVDETGAPRRRRVRSRRAQRKQVKKATPTTQQAASSLDNRVKAIERDLKSLGTALKSKGIAKVAGSGNRAFFSATAAATAAGATVTPAAVVGNADQAYDRVVFMANTPSLLAAMTVAGNPLLDGSASVPVDVFPLGPTELAEPVKVNGNGGVILTHTNRGAAVGDASVILLPVGHSWGSAAPGAF